MNILLCSHAAWRHTGYGAPVLPLVKEWRKRGHTVSVLAVEERGPGLMEYKGIPHYLPALSRYGEDVIRPIADDCQADVVISLFDAWVLAPEGGFGSPNGYSGCGRPWIAWTPVDQYPPARGLVERLSKATRALSFSEWGAGMLSAVGLTASTLPLGVDLDVFKPIPEARARMRESLGLPENAFVAGMVGSNLPGDRKALAQNIEGFCEFANTSPESYLVLWTTRSGGFDITAYLGQLGDGASRVKIISQWELAYGGRAEKLSAFYSALDVLLHASASEGFGLPILEAMACGTPVIGTANTSMPELVPERCGWLAKDMRREWTRLDGWWERPYYWSISQALTKAEVEITALADLKVERPFVSECRGWARGFSWDIIADRWEDVLQSL